MTLDEQVQKNAEGYGKLAPAFLEGTKFVLESQWISVDEDLPCNHKELLMIKKLKMRISKEPILVLKNLVKLQDNKMFKRKYPSIIPNNIKRIVRFLPYLRQ